MIDETNNVDFALARMDKQEKTKLKAEVYDDVLKKLNPVEQEEIEKMTSRMTAKLRGFGETSAKELIVSLGIAIEKRMRHVEAKKKMREKRE